jgi:hypothetical protein
MKNICISGGKAVVVIGNTVRKKKVFCFYGMDTNKRIELGSISAYTIEEATKILEANKIKGIYKIKEIDTEKEFQVVGTFTKAH